MSENVKRGATRHEGREVSYEWDADNPINPVWCCTECGDPLELRQRQEQVDYVEIGCPCGAAVLDLRLADVLQFSMDEWDTRTISDLERGPFAEGGELDVE